MSTLEELERAADPVEWSPIDLEQCESCGRIAPGYYEKRDEHIADSIGQVSATRIAKGYGVSEGRIREIAVEVLGRRAYIEAVMKVEGWKL